MIFFNYSALRLERYWNDLAINCYVIILPLDLHIEDSASSIAKYFSTLSILLSHFFLQLLKSIIPKSFIQKLRDFLWFCVKIKKFTQTTSSEAEATNENKWQSSQSIIMSLPLDRYIEDSKIPITKCLSILPTFSLVSSLSTYQLPHFRAPLVLLSIAWFSSSFVLVPHALFSCRDIIGAPGEAARSTEQRSNSGTVGIPKGRGKDTRDNVV